MLTDEIRYKSELYEEVNKMLTFEERLEKAKRHEPITLRDIGLAFRVLFLDVDGVLNSRYTRATAPSGCVGVGSRYIKRVKEIVDATDAKVVLTSDWRLARDDDYAYLTQTLYKGDIYLYSQTPNLRWQWRGREIGEWLKEHDVDSYVILDDIFFDDFESMEQHLVLTDPDKGLTNQDVKKAIEILNGGN